MQPFFQFDAPGIQLVSFDVFDTVLARRCGTPGSIFAMTGEKVAARSIMRTNSVTFHRLRIAAEQQVRREKKREVTLGEIYEELNRHWLLPDSVLQQIMEVELETERENLFPVPGAAFLVNAARAAGKRVAFVSDMYLPAEFIREALADAGLIRNQEPLYVSSEWKVSKADGGLFRILIEREKVRPAAVLHIGDSRRVDFENARRTGLQAMHDQRGALNRFEAALAGSEESICGTSRLAGIARRARLEADPFGRNAEATTFGASIAGPLLTSYADWVLRTALSRGIKRLYFLARDAEIFLEISRVLAPRVGAEQLELHYLYGSRQTWYPAALQSLDDSAAGFFASAVAFSAGSWEQCVKYLGFDAIDPKLASLSNRWADWKPSIESKSRLFLDVATDPECGLLLRERLQARSALASRYLREAGLLGDDRCALVDCGWSGVWTDIISDLITAQGGNAPEVYFLGRRSANRNSRAFTLAWLFDHQAGTGLKDIPEFFHVVTEFFLTASHGRTVDFVERQGSLRPDLGPVDLQGFKPGEWTAFRAGILRFADIFSTQPSRDSSTIELRQALVDPIRLLWERPSRQEAALLGDHRIGLSPVRSGNDTLACGYRVTDLLRLMFYFRLPGYSPFWWHEGSQTKTAFTVRAAMGVLWETRQMISDLLRRDPSMPAFRFLRQAGFKGLKQLRWQLWPARDVMIWEELKPPAASVPVCVGSDANQMQSPAAARSRFSI